MIFDWVNGWRNYAILTVHFAIRIFESTGIPCFSDREISHYDLDIQQQQRILLHWIREKQSTSSSFLRHYMITSSEAYSCIFDNRWKQRSVRNKHCIPPRRAMIAPTVAHRDCRRRLLFVLVGLPHGDLLLVGPYPVLPSFPSRTMEHMAVLVWHRNLYPPSTRNSRSATSTN